MNEKSTGYNYLTISAIIDVILALASLILVVILQKESSSELYQSIGISAKEGLLGLVGFYILLILHAINAAVAFMTRNKPEAWKTPYILATIMVVLVFLTTNWSVMNIINVAIPLIPPCFMISGAIMNKKQMQEQ